MAKKQFPFIYTMPVPNVGSFTVEGVHYGSADNFDYNAIVYNGLDITAMILDMEQSECLLDMFNAATTNHIENNFTL